MRVIRNQTKWNMRIQIIQKLYFKQMKQKVQRLKINLHKRNKKSRYSQTMKGFWAILSWISDSGLEIQVQFSKMIEEEITKSDHQEEIETIVYLQESTCRVRSKKLFLIDKYPKNQSSLKTKIQCNNSCNPTEQSFEEQIGTNIKKKKRKLRSVLEMDQET